MPLDIICLILGPSALSPDTRTGDLSKVCSPLMTDGKDCPQDPAQDGTGLEDGWMDG